MVVPTSRTRCVPDSSSAGLLAVLPEGPGASSAWILRVRPCCFVWSLGAFIQQRHSGDLLCARPWARCWKEVIRKTWTLSLVNKQSQGRDVDRHGYQEVQYGVRSVATECCSKKDSRKLEVCTGNTGIHEREVLLCWIEDQSGKDCQWPPAKGHQGNTCSHNLLHQKRVNATENRGCLDKRELVGLTGGFGHVFGDLGKSTVKLGSVLDWCCQKVGQFGLVMEKPSAPEVLSEVFLKFSTATDIL
ncbi:uncharacterized protein LOC129058375 [Pongo abelii]|uniref:uncharacterized protein LOC129058375 n=1 Tax=Pongo abelii TaxID=9601 RepID=UPI0030050ABD